MAIKSFKRYEMKFLLNKSQYDVLIPRLLKYMNPDENCRLGKNYNIYNIYFDTADDSVIRHSTSKPYYKEKLRLRSYGVIKADTDTVFLELKKKIGGVVNKRRVVMTYGEAQKYLQTGQKPVTDDFVTNQVLKEIDYYLKMNRVYPKVYINYTRKAFFGKDNRNFRITFDTDITTRRYDLSLDKGSYGERLLESDKYLMEVKILGAMPLWLTQIFSELQIYKASFSKYGTEYKNYCIKKINNNDQEIRREEIC